MRVLPKTATNKMLVNSKQQPFEATFRLQVGLPRNQLCVLRVSPKTTVEQVLAQICSDRGIDGDKYELRHPGN